MDKKRNETWNLILNAGEIRQIRLTDILEGLALPWKIAIWGSHHDAQLLQKVSARFRSIGDYEGDGLLIASSGPQLFQRNSRPDAEPTDGRTRGITEYKVEKCKEVIGKNILDVKPLAKMRRFFAFPASAIKLYFP